MRPAVPLYWRATAADFVLFFRKPVSSTISTASRFGQRLEHVRSTEVARPLLVPLHVREHPLRAPRPGVANMLGRLPAVLAFHRTQQALEIEPGLPTRLGAREQLAQATLQLAQLRPPIKNAHYAHALSGCHPTYIQRCSPHVRKFNCSTRAERPNWACSELCEARS